jgi:hypothetical protein
MCGWWRISMELENDITVGLWKRDFFGRSGGGYKRIKWEGVKEERMKGRRKMVVQRRTLALEGSS